jgi:L-malate glycosyltransferase
MPATRLIHPQAAPPLRLLHLTTFLQGGAGRAIADLACAQHAAGHRVSVVTSATETGGFGNYPEYLSRLRDAGVSLHACDSLFSRDPAHHERVLDLLMREFDVADVDVIHAHAAVPAAIGQRFAATGSQQVPVVQTQHGWGVNKTAAQAAFDIDVLKRVDGVLTTSKATRDLLVGYGVPGRSISVIPCGITGNATAEPPAVARRMLDWLRAAGMRIIGCIGSVNANKNQRLVIDALKALGDPNVAAAFVGEGGESLLEHARAAGVADRVVLCGYQPQAADWLPLFDALAVPSRTEGQGLVVLEAFRAGVPVVASNIPALAELIDDGRTGRLFETDNAAALAAAIRCTLALNPLTRAVMVNAARARFLADYTVDRMVDRHEQLYRVL